MNTSKQRGGVWKTASDGGTLGLVRGSVSGHPITTGLAQYGSNDIVVVVGINWPSYSPLAQHKLRRHFLSRAGVRALHRA
jgi:hypothetical protein